MSGFSDDEIEILIVLALEAHGWLFGDGCKTLARRLKDREETLESAGQALLEPAPEKRKRKILNGVRKLLGGAITGIGNCLLAAGTLVAPNPATGATAIASGAIAVTSILGGLGDLRGE